MTDIKMVTAWTIDAGYVRTEPCAEYLSYDAALDEVGASDQAQRMIGYSVLANEFEDNAASYVEVFEHEKTRSLFVDLWSGDRVITTLHVSADDRDAFLFTEYPLIVQRIKAAHQAGALERIEKALVAFIRHGHGTHTISEFGMTYEERQNERERLRLWEERKRREKQQPGEA